VFIIHLQDDWVKWLSLAEFAINNGTSESTMTTAFCAVAGRDPRMTFVREPTNEWHCPHFDSNHIQATLELTEEFHSVGMPQSNPVYEAEANRGQISALNVQVACHAGLEGQHIQTTRPAWKLDWKHLGHVNVLRQVSLCTYDFKFPALIPNHQFRPVLLVYPAVNDPLAEQPVSPPPAVEDDCEEEYQVVNIEIS
jgi:hypothetical protein